MSREIKFRAWHCEINKFIQVDAIDFSGGTIRVGEPVLVDDRENRGCYLLKNCVLQQFTGLHDKNGTEIYEGDIVRWDVRPEGELICVVEWELHGAAFEFRNDKEGLCYAIHQDAAMDYVEVIGNRFENPELFEAEE